MYSTHTTCSSGIHVGFFGNIFLILFKIYGYGYLKYSPPRRSYPGTYSTRVHLTSYCTVCTGYPGTRVSRLIRVHVFYRLQVRTTKVGSKDAEICCAKNYPVCITRLLVVLVLVVVLIVEVVVSIVAIFKFLELNFITILELIFQGRQDKSWDGMGWEPGELKLTKTCQQVKPQDD